MCLVMQLPVSMPPHNSVTPGGDSCGVHDRVFHTYVGGAFVCLYLVFLPYVCHTFG